LVLARRRQTAHLGERGIDGALVPMLAAMTPLAME